MGCPSQAEGRVSAAETEEMGRAKKKKSEEHGHQGKSLLMYQLEQC